MADFETAARPYARAFFEMAEEAGNMDYIKMNKESIAEWMN